MRNNVIFLQAQESSDARRERLHGPKMLLWAFVCGLFAIAGLIELYYQVKP